MFRWAQFRKDIIRCEQINKYPWIDLARDDLRSCQFLCLVSCESSGILQWLSAYLQAAQARVQGLKISTCISTLPVNRFWPPLRSVPLRERRGFWVYGSHYNLTLSMTAIIEGAKRNTMYDIAGGDIACALLWNGSADQQLVSHRIIGPNCLTQSW